LIPGAQALFGVKTQLQFGKLWVTTIFANQRSQRQSLSLQGGAATNPIYFKADDYDENETSCSHNISGTITTPYEKSAGGNFADSDSAH
jgi:hypothetical protein